MLTVRRCLCIIPFYKCTGKKTNQRPLLLPGTLLLFWGPRFKTNTSSYTMSLLYFIKYIVLQVTALMLKEITLQLHNIKSLLRRKKIFQTVTWCSAYFYCTFMNQIIYKTGYSHRCTFRLLQPLSTWSASYPHFLLFPGNHTPMATLVPNFR